MRSSSGAVCLAVVLLALGGPAVRAQAQAPVQGFAVERLYQSAPGGGWFVMDALDMQGGLGGAMALSLGYASRPLVVTGGVQPLAVVSDQAFADFAAAITYDRLRAYVLFDVPLVITGQSGAVGGSSFTAPSVNLASTPDTLTDLRIGLDVRICGGPRGRFRLGAGAQLFIPFGTRADYDTDNTFRGALRLLGAGDARYFTYAAQLGAHVRPLDDSPTPGSPHGSELLFGVAGGAKLPVGPRRTWAVVVGPEVYGATAFKSFFGADYTALEGLVSGRLEGTRVDAMQVRVKLGVGGGLYQRFGAPQWRVVFGIEVFNHHRTAR